MTDLSASLSLTVENGKIKAAPANKLCSSAEERQGQRLLRRPVDARPHLAAQFHRIHWGYIWIHLHIYTGSSLDPLDRSFEYRFFACYPASANRLAAKFCISLCLSLICECHNLPDVCTQRRYRSLQVNPQILAICKHLPSRASALAGTFKRP